MAFPWLNVNLNIINIIDIAIVAFLVYKLIMLIRGTRAVQLVQGLVVLLVANTVSNWLGLNTVHWILQQAMTALVVALPVVFQPELRRGLERLGRGGALFTRSLAAANGVEVMRSIEAVVQAAQVLSGTKTGALIVFEAATGLEDYIDTGIKIDALVSAPLLVNTFVPNTPLHDGAVILRGERLVAAAALLPLSENPYVDKNLGTRHRAALGISEVSDAVALVISEETGVISLAREGKLHRFLNETSLRQLLLEFLQLPVQHNLASLWHRRGKK